MDFLSDGDTSAGHAPNQLLAAASGAINYVCNDGLNVAIRIGDLMYLHLNYPNANLVVGRTFIQGDELGPLKKGSFSGNCGYASQGANWFHVHWNLPNTGSFQAGGWTLQFADQLWHRGTQTVGIYQWMRSENTAWSIDYFTDASFSTRCNGALEETTYVFKQWFANPPATGCPANTFGARFAKQVSFQGGSYTFRTQRAGRARVWLDGQTLIDLWQPGDGGLDATRVLTGLHEVKVEFAGAQISPTLGVWWYGPGALPSAPSPDPSTWRAEYYGNRTLWGQPALVLNESSSGVNHPWGDAGPGYGLPVDDWSARYTRDVSFACGTYQFNVRADDGVRLWVGNQLLIDEWREQVADFTADLDLTGGTRSVKVEYYERGWGALLVVDWQRVSTAACGDAKPDLRPYTPAGWGGAVVASPAPGTHLMGTLVAGQPAYFDWALVNDGLASTSAGFEVELWIDGNRRLLTDTLSLGVGLMSTREDWSTTVITPRLHTVRLVIDPANAIPEMNETNNTWQGAFYWQESVSATQPRVYLPATREE